MALSVVGSDNETSVFNEKLIEEPLQEFAPPLGQYVL